MKKLGLSIFGACALMIGVGGALTTHATSTTQAFLWDASTQKYDIPSTPEDVMDLCDGHTANCGEIVTDGTPTFFRLD